MKNKKVEVKISLPLWVITLISFFLSVISYSMVVAKYGICFSLFFAAIVFVSSFIYYLFAHPIIATLFGLRKEVANLISPD